MLILLCCFFASTNFRMHEHIVNGERIAHSHPGAADGHSHSDAQLTTIDLLTQFQSEGTESCFHVEKVAAPIVIIECSHIQEIYSSAELSIKTLRSPPQTRLS